MRIKVGHAGKNNGTNKVRLISCYLFYSTGMCFIDLRLKTPDHLNDIVKEFMIKLKKAPLSVFK